jgi:aryl-alcohol dehydrogenase-like predicted oxidoreductase
MLFHTIAGIEKPVSRLVLGTMLEGSVFASPHAHALFDDFYERGGNAFDTARIYGGGLGEKIFGKWLGSRGVRDSVFILGKGAHPPDCTPEGATSQFLESLTRMNIEYVDLYMPHRDNLDVPVADWVECFNEHIRAGRMKAWGGSNWTTARLDEALEYAKSRGLQGPSGVSNNVSLARMVSPVWNGCFSFSDAESRAWLEARQMPTFSWSSQARGFFVRGDHNYTDDSELVRCWYSDDNFERLARVQSLAKERGVSPITVALAWVLHQRYPSFALVGPRNIEEIRSCVDGLQFSLSEAEMKHINLEN